jgi:hypothetical protein
VRRGEEITLVRFLGWVGAAGIDVSNPQVAAEAQRVVDTIEGTLLRAEPLSYSSTEFGRHTSVGTTTRAGQPTWMMPSWVALWVVLWILGAWRFGRRHRHPYEQSAMQTLK